MIVSGSECSRKFSNSFGCSNNWFRFILSGKIKSFQNFQFLRIFSKNAISVEFQKKNVKICKTSSHGGSFWNDPVNWSVLMGLRCIHTDVSHFFVAEHFLSMLWVYYLTGWILRIETSCHFSTVETLKCNRWWRHFPTCVSNLAIQF